VLVRARLYKLQKGVHSAAIDKVYLLLAHGWWFSPCTPASSTTKTGRHYIAEILLKVALKTINQIKFNYRGPIIPRFKKISRIKCALSISGKKSHIKNNIHTRDDFFYISYTTNSRINKFFFTSNALQFKLFDVDI
jgi:hypothetical protein